MWPYPAAVYAWDQTDWPTDYVVLHKMYHATVLHAVLRLLTHVGFFLIPSEVFRYMESIISKKVHNRATHSILLPSKLLPGHKCGHPDRSTTTVHQKPAWKTSSGKIQLIKADSWNYYKMLRGKHRRQRRARVNHFMASSPPPPPPRPLSSAPHWLRRIRYLWKFLRF